MWSKVVVILMVIIVCLENFPIIICRGCFLQILASDDDHDALSTKPNGLIHSDEIEGINEEEEDIFRYLLVREGFFLTYGDSPSLLLDPYHL